MAAYIADGYNDGGVQLLEAGTGVGKSFAYLVPALHWARANGERTVVSTNTINLQEQLVGKDLPTLRRALGTAEYTPTFALLKGWRNYLCLARLNQAVASQRTLLEPDKLDELIGIAEWAGHTADGTLSDLPVTPSSEVWDEVSAEADLCTRLKCGHFDKCFLFRARRRAAEADVVVVNHHLLAADLSVRQAQDNWEEAAVLPPYRRLVLDEAHHLEDVAAAHLGVQVGSRAVRRLLARFERNGRGLVPTLAHELMGRGDLLSRASMDLLTQRMVPALADARRASEAMFLRLLRSAGRRPGGTAPAVRGLRGRRDLGPGPRLRAGRDAGRVPRAARVGRDHRRPPGRVGGVRAARHHPAGAARGDAPAGRGLGRPQPYACAPRAAAPRPSAGWSARRAGSRCRSPPSRSTWRRSCGPSCSTGWTRSC